MRIEKDRFGEDAITYDSRVEEKTAIRNYLCGNFAALTCEEVAFFRSCEEDPYGFRWEADHSGMMSDDVDELDFNGLVFIHDIGRTFEEGKELLLRMVGRHPITPLTLWELEKRLARGASPTPHQHRVAR